MGGRPEPKQHHQHRDRGATRRQKTLYGYVSFRQPSPLINSDAALLVNWLELVTTNEDGKVTFRNAWATSHDVDKINVAELAKAGRARWKIENENNNTLKTKAIISSTTSDMGKSISPT